MSDDSPKQRNTNPDEMADALNRLFRDRLAATPPAQPPAACDYLRLYCEAQAARWEQSADSWASLGQSADMLAARAVGMAYRECAAHLRMILALTQAVAPAPAPDPEPAPQAPGDGWTLYAVDSDPLAPPPAAAGPLSENG